MAFCVGMKVVCVDNSSDGRYVPSGFVIVGTMNGLTRGQIYTVRQVGELVGVPCLWLHEIVREVVNPLYGECGFAAVRFRPVVERKTDISIFTEILKTAGRKAPARLSETQNHSE